MGFDNGSRRSGDKPLSEPVMVYFNDSYIGKTIAYIVNIFLYSMFRNQVKCIELVMN